MKKISFFILLIIMLFVVNITNVNARQDETIYKTSNGINYTIEGFSINIYDGSKDENDIPNYLNGNKQLLYTIPIPLDEQLSYKIEETVSNNKDSKGSYIDMNFNISKEKVLELIKTKLPNINDNTSYYAEVVVNYKIVSMPNIYKTSYHLNIMEYVLSILTKGIEQISLNTTTSQILDIAEYSKKNNVENFVIGIDVLKNLGDASTGTDIDTNVGMFDYMVFIDSDNLESMTSNNILYIFMIHNSDEITKKVNEENSIIDNNETINKVEENKTQPTEIVKTDDTSKNISITVYIASFILAFIGIVFIVTSKRMI